MNPLLVADMYTVAVCDIETDKQKSNKREDELICSRDLSWNHEWIMICPSDGEVKGSRWRP